jgi:hypothetical protein
MIAKSSLGLVFLFVLFACGHRQPVASPEVRATNSQTLNQNAPKPTLPPEAEPTPEVEMTLADGLKLVPKNITLENEPRRYKIDVTYPQVEGTKQSGFVVLNKRIKSLVMKQYAWPLIPPTKEDLRHYEKWPGVYNSVDLDYDVVLSTDKTLSIYFDVYSYGIGAAHQVQQSFTVNFDMTTNAFITLESLFKPETRPLQFISNYCIDKLSKDHSWSMNDPIFRKEVAPEAKNFESWNIVSHGLRFNFDECKIDGCAGGKAEVVIPFAELKQFLRPPFAPTKTSSAAGA